MWIALSWAAAAVVATAPQQAPGAERLYGRVMTADGEMVEGYLRWDENEASAADILDGEKEIPWSHLEEAMRLDEDGRGWRARERSITVFGIRVSWDEDDLDPETASSGIRFAYLEGLEVLDERRALLYLTSGETVELRSSSTDLGRGFRGLVVDRADGGTMDLRWRDLDRVEFFSPPASASPTAGRLHGTVRTGSGLEFTGFIAWDMDEVLTSDMLDGEEDGEDRSIPFERIGAIERVGPGGSRVVLSDGRELLLEDSNDVDSGNRGIEISDPSLGRVRVAWRDFSDIRFHPPVPDAGRPLDAPGRRLFATVQLRDGTTRSGNVRWDNDEEFAWELLNGEARGGPELGIEFGRIGSVERRGRQSVEVVLLDGRHFVLDGSNDVNDENRGIFVQLDSGETVLVPWRDFMSASFEW
jgi:hypothetical protein